MILAGAKFGGYGSFLPTYERSPSVWSRPKTPQKNYNAPKSPNNLPNEVYGSLLLTFWSFGGKRYILLTPCQLGEV